MLILYRLKFPLSDISYFMMIINVIAKCSGYGYLSLVLSMIFRVQNMNHISVDGCKKK